jgi:hypothetical protein
MRTLLLSMLLVAAIASSVVAGALWDRVSPAAPFWLGAGAALTALVVLAAIAVRRTTGRRSDGRFEACCVWRSWFP